MDLIRSYLLLSWCLSDLYIAYGNIITNKMETPNIIKPYQKYSLILFIILTLLSLDQHL